MLFLWDMLRGNLRKLPRPRIDSHLNYILSTGIANYVNNVPLILSSPFSLLPSLLSAVLCLLPSLFSTSPFSLLSSLFSLLPSPFSLLSSLFSLLPSPFSLLSCALSSPFSFSLLFSFLGEGRREKRERR